MVDLIFYDFEVFKYDWLVVIGNATEKEEKIFVNDREGLYDYFTVHKNDIWIGYNSRNYDQWVLRAVLCDIDPWRVSNWIIKEGQSGSTFSTLMKRWTVYGYDVSTAFHSLKQIEGFMGEDIRETSVPFDINRPLTEEEIRETVDYCRSDVTNTMRVFMATKNKFDSQIALIRTFGLDMTDISKTQAQLASVILGADASRQVKGDAWDISLPDTLRLDKYRGVADWFLKDENHDNSKTLAVTVNGIEHVFAWGGVHGAIPLNYECKNDEIMVMADVNQLYPSLMVRYDLLSRAVSEPEKFVRILDTSLRLKREKKKKEREPYKLICNIVYGAMGDRFNPMYDPRNRTLVCVYGQVLLLDLIEKIEGFTRLIQSNTDGILVLIKKEDFDKLDDAVFEWEERTGLRMTFDYYGKVIQKDVNNYVAVGVDGSVKCKGAYVKELSDIDYDLPIVNKAIREYLLNGVHPRITINGCNDLREFQKIVKVSSKYDHGVQNGKVLNGKTFRVFASVKAEDGYIGRCKGDGRGEKFANTPDRCFVHNEKVLGLNVPERLDRQWYIDLAVKRIRDFGMGIDSIEQWC